MCFNVSVNKDPEFLEQRFHAKFFEPESFKPIYHVSAFKTPSLPIISNNDAEHIQLFQWGLIPFWVEDETKAEKIRFNTFNARDDTIYEKPSYKFSIKKKRCLVLVDGFYEWRLVKGKKYPYYIKMKNNDAFALAGIWDTWKNKNSDEIKNTFSVITTRANPLLEKIHNVKKRMPVILNKEHGKRWLDYNLDKDEINSLMNPIDDKNMEGYTISKLITARGVDNNIPEVMKKFEYPELKYEQKKFF